MACVDWRRATRKSLRRSFRGFVDELPTGYVPYELAPQELVDGVGRDVSGGAGSEDRGPVRAGLLRNSYYVCD